MNHSNHHGGGGDRGGGGGGGHGGGRHNGNRSHSEADLLGHDMGVGYDYDSR